MTITNEEVREWEAAMEEEFAEPSKDKAYAAQFKILRGIAEALASQSDPETCLDIEDLRHLARRYRYYCDRLELVRRAYELEIGEWEAAQANMDALRKQEEIEAQRKASHGET